VKVGLIAMSGVRACDPALLELGLTLPGFLERGRTIASLPSLGLLTLAGLGPARHRYEYFEIADLRQAASIPQNVDLVAISSFSAQIDEAYELADRYRAARIPVVLGGLHVTSLPDEAARHADAIVVGEAEPVWTELLADAEAGRLRPRYQAQSEFGLEDAPLPAFELLDPERYNRLTVQTSRGCPFRCEFCAGSILLTRRYKQKPIAKVLAEIDRIRAIWRRPFIEFADDNSFVNRRYWKELLGELTSRRIRWFTECDLSVYQDAELLALMRDSGCAEVLIGFESPVETGLAGLELNCDWKRRRWAEYKRAIARIQSHGIRVNGCFILGLDGHTPEIFDAVYDFALDAELFDVQVTIQTPFPATPLYHRLQRTGRLRFDGDWRRCTLFDVNYEPSGMSVAELEGGFRQLIQRLYSEPATRAWRDNFQRKYRWG
jgi:radical SAM superfamily enzyme YgiQ (UPF0313 family)